MNKKNAVILITTIVIVSTLCILGYILLDSKKEVVKNTSHISIPKKEIVTNKNKPSPHYNEFYFQKSAGNPFEGIRIIFEDISLKDIVVLSGEKQIKQDRKDYPDEFMIDVAHLNGNYHLKYKNTDIVIKDSELFINGNKKDHRSLIINSKEEISWDAFINYWEIPIDKVTEQDKKELEEQIQKHIREMEGSKKNNVNRLLYDR